MARKATDLLDVFRFSSEDGDAEAQGARKARRAKRHASAKRKARPSDKQPRRSRFEGIALNRRQVWLASSAVGLLLILSFFLGLAAGGSGSGAGSEALERRVPRRWAIRARVPLVDPAKRNSADRSRLEKALVGDYGINPRHLRIRRLEGEFLIDIGPFPSRDEARNWLGRSGLELWRVNMEDPFRFPEYVALDGDSAKR